MNLISARDSYNPTAGPEGPAAVERKRSKSDLILLDDDRVDLIKFCSQWSLHSAPTLHEDDDDNMDAEIFNSNRRDNEDEALVNRKLPKELLLRVFSHLDVVSLCRCAQVSKSWNQLALDGSNWQHVDLFDFQTDVVGEVVENISSRCGGFLKTLSLKGCRSVTDDSLRIFAQNCPNIEELNLNDCKKLTDSTCAYLSSHCKKLLRLNLSSDAMTDLSLKALGEGCNELKELNISFCESMSKEGLSLLASGTPNLRVIIAKMCPLVNDEAISIVAQHCPSLEAVNLHGCSAISDDSLIALSRSCSGLLYVCVSNCSQLTDTGLIALSTTCLRLKTLEVSGCSQLTDTAFQAIARQCHQLENLDLEECVLITDSTLSFLAAGCPNLKKLSLSHCELITDEGIRQLGSSSCSAESLEVLELDNCPLITDTALDHLIYCHALQRIELYDCQLITRSGIRRLKSHLPELKIHAYFAPDPGPGEPPAGGRPRYCRCCLII